MRHWVHWRWFLQGQRTHKDVFCSWCHYATHCECSAENRRLDHSYKMINSSTLKRGQDSIKKILSSGSPWLMNWLLISRLIHIVETVNTENTSHSPLEKQTTTHTQHLVNHSDLLPAGGVVKGYQTETLFFFIKVENLITWWNGLKTSLLLSPKWKQLGKMLFWNRWPRKFIRIVSQCSGISRPGSFLRSHSSVG